MTVIRLLQVGILTALIFLGISFPLILNFKSSIFVNPDWPFDSLGTIYAIWWFQYAWEHGIAPTYNFLLAHPFGLDWSHLPVQPLLTYPLFFFSLIGGEIFAFNFYVLFNYVLTGIVTYGLCYYCTRHERGSLLGALIYTFAPNHLLQTMGHLGFSSTQWLPLFILCWLYFWEKRSWFSAFVCALSICFLFWSNYYIFYFSLFFVLSFFCVAFFYRKLLAWKGGILRLMGIGFFCALLLAPQWIPIAKKVFTPNPSAEVRASGYARSYQDVVKYAACFSDYFLPSEFHPLLSKITHWHQKEITKKGRHFSDRTLYLGFFPLFMAIALLFFRRRYEQRDRFLIALSFFCALFFIWFSLSPWLKVGPISIPTPSAWLHPFFPMFRFYSRAGFLVSLFVALLVAYSWKYFPIKFSKERTRNWVCAAAAALILFEFCLIPPFHNLNLAKTPEVYQWLKEQPDDFAIVEYPFPESIQEQQQKYMFYQRLHQKSLVNGGDAGTLSDMLRKHAQHIDDPKMWSLLAYFGTRYAVVHPYQNKEKFKQIESLKLIETFGKTDLYQIEAKPEPIYTLKWNFGQFLKGEDGHFWQWIGQTAKLWSLNTQKVGVIVRLKLKIHSPEQNTLKIFLNKKEIFQIEMEKRGMAALNIPNLKLSPGENVIEFKSARLVSHPEEVERKISFQLSQCELVLP